MSVPSTTATMATSTPSLGGGSFAHSVTPSPNWETVRPPNTGPFTHMNPWDVTNEARSLMEDLSNGKSFGSMKLGTITVTPSVGSKRPRGLTRRVIPCGRRFERSTGAESGGSDRRGPRGSSAWGPRGASRSSNVPKGITPVEVKTELSEGGSNVLKVWNVTEGGKKMSGWSSSTENEDVLTDGEGSEVSKIFDDDQDDMSTPGTSVAGSDVAQ